MDWVILTAALVGGYLIHRLGLPPLVGFLLAGIGLSTLGYTATPLMETGAEVGVTLLLFSIGLKLRIGDLLKREVLAVAAIHMVVVTLLFGLIILGLGFVGLQYFMGIGTGKALLLAFALSFSSTVFAVKMLEQSGRMNALTGRTAIGILVIQDLVAVIFLTVMKGVMPSPWALLVLALLPPATWLFRRMLERAGHGELMVLMGVFLALVAGAHAFDVVQLKPDLGALVLGMLLAPHKRSKELANSLLGLKDLLLVAFFLEIGLNGLPGPRGLLAAGVLTLLLPIKMMFFFLLLARFRLKARTAFVTTMNLACYSEFGLIVAALAAKEGWLEAEWLVVIGITMSLSLIIASPLNSLADNLYARWRVILRRFQTEARHPEEEPLVNVGYEIIVVGMGRIGEGAYDWLQDRYGQVVVGLEFDAEKVEFHKQAGRSMFQADVADPDFWRRLPEQVDTIRMVVLALSNLETMLFVLGKLRGRGATAVIAAVAYHDDEVAALQEAGADAAFNAFGEAGSGLASHACEHLDARENPDGAGCTENPQTV